MIQKFPKVSEATLVANPSALHKEGVAARQAIEAARALCAKTLEVHSDEIIFTSGATESDNLAIIGTTYAWMQKGMVANEILIVSSELEHAVIAESVKRLQVRSQVLAAEEGVIDPKDIIMPEGVKAVLVSVMYVSNEIGTVQPIAEIAKRIRKLRKDYPDVQFVFHTDATQAPEHFSLRVPSLGIDMMTLGATKLYCTKGVGLLYKKRNCSLAPILVGGGQEKGVRPGTESLSLIHEFAHALMYAVDHRQKESEHITELRQFFESEIEKNFPEFKITAKHLSRSPHITHIGIPNFDSELMVLELDARGIAVSSKSACKNEEGNESPIVESIYGKGWGAVRFSFGRVTKKSDLESALHALKEVFLKYKAI